MNNLKRRRESVASVYRKTTKFLTTNTSQLLKKTPNTKKYRLLARVAEEYRRNEETNKIYGEEDESENESDSGERDLDYYLGVRRKETYWRDPAGKEQIMKDYLMNHCGVSEDEYNKLYKKTTPKVSYPVQPKPKQVPFKIHKKRDRKSCNSRESSDSWREKRKIFKIFNRKDSDSTSDSYSECESNDDIGESSDIDNIEVNKNDIAIWNITTNFNGLNTFDICDILSVEGVRIKEVSDGRPCDNCPELCPGFISHPWRSFSQGGKAVIYPTPEIQYAMEF